MFGALVLIHARACSTAAALSVQEIAESKRVFFMGSENRGKSLQAFCAESDRGELLREWDAEKNGGKTPSDVSMGSHQKVWWLCPKGHSYCSVVKSRTQGTGCPICAGRVVLSDENSLAAKYPALAAEWDTEKNAPLLPTQVASGTLRKVWWLCPKGHSYYSSIASRAGGSTGCPVLCRSSSYSQRKRPRFTISTARRAMGPKEERQAEAGDGDAKIQPPCLVAL